MDLRALWKDLFNSFDAKARLESWEDAELYVERPGSASKNIEGALPLREKGKWLLCGSAGSGKSSELVHLARRLWNDYAVVALDLPSTTLLVQRLTPAEVIFLIGAGATRIAQEQNRPLPANVTNRLVESFRGTLGAGLTVNIPQLLEGVALFAANVAMPGAGAAVGGAIGAAKAIGSALGSRAIGGTTRSLHEGDRDVEELVDCVNATLRALSENAGRPTVVLVDGLDKIVDLNSIRSLFTNTQLLGRADAAIVYAAPITLMINTDWKTAGAAFEPARLSNIVVQPPTVTWVELPESTVAGGREAMRSVVKKRLASSNRHLEDVFTPAALEDLITNSGGVLRDLIQLVNRCCQIAHGPVSGDPAPIINEAIAKSASDEYRKELEIPLNGKRVDELLYVRKNGQPSGDGDVSSDLLLNGYVLPYANGRVWYEPHPLLRGLRPGL